jgi:ATP-dependent Lhr-like helicase
MMPYDIRSTMPDASRVFFRNRELRPIQEIAIPPVLRGESVFISSPTASGKTEACLAPLYQRHVSFGRDRLSVVYIAPTKALVNDMHGRLVDYFGHTSADAIRRYTGDRHEFERAEGAFILLCSPEGLDSLQLTRPEMLAGVRAVVIDELHFLHGTARGQQARAVIHRLESAASPPFDSRDTFQKIGMTATLDEPEEVAGLWLGKGAGVLSIGSAREIEMTFLDASASGSAAVIRDAVSRGHARKVLAFSNTRNGAHALASQLSEVLREHGWPVYLHIGILSASEREEVEAAIRREPKALCVATSTLELGIDIGDVDAVVLAEPPATISGFLQRIGRGNRRSDKCRVWAVVNDPSDQGHFQALHHCAVRGFIDDVHEYQRPSVEFQQIMSHSWERTRRDKALTSTGLAELLGPHISTATLDDMLGTGALQQVGSALLPNQAWMDQGEKRRIHTVLSAPAGVPIIDLHSGEEIGAAPRNPQTVGKLFTGTRVREIRAADESGFYLGPSGKRPSALAVLPKGRGRPRGFPRRLVWAMAELQGVDPRGWTFRGGVLQTWGGGDFNRLLRETLLTTGLPESITADSFGIGGLTTLPVATPAQFKPLIEKVVRERRIRPAATNAFRESTSQFSHLGPRLQAEESYRAIPLAACLRWLDQCAEIQTPPD